MEVVRRIETDVLCTGHHAVYCRGLRALVMFGGLLSAEISPAIIEAAKSVSLQYLPLQDIIDQERDSLTWNLLRAEHAEPRSRHGHFLHCYNGEIYLMGGNYWSLSDEFPHSDMAFNIASRTWRSMGSMVALPPRFCAAVAPMVTRLSHVSNAPEVDNVSSVVSIGGMSDQFTLTSSVSIMDFSTMQCTRVTTVGDVPPPQFKGGAAYDERSHSVYLVDGYFEDDNPEEKRVRVLDLSNSVWRSVCMAPPMVRFQLIPRWSGLESSQMALMELHVVGGMRMHTWRRRENSLYTFQTASRMWERYGKPKELEGMVGPTAHIAIEVPVFTVKRETPEGQVNSTSVSWVTFGGNIDEDPSVENGNGIPSKDIHVFCFRKQSLKLLAAQAIHRMRLPYEMNCAQERDDLLDELF